MTDQELLAQVAAAIVDGNEADARKTGRAALDAGIDPVEIMQGGVAQGMQIMGKKFEAFEVFLPALMVSAEAAEAVLELTAPHMNQSQAARATLGKVVLGTVVGDIHDIGKNLVAAILASSGFEVHDLGVEVRAMDFIKKAREVNAAIIGMSSLMTTGMPYQKDLLDYLNDMGLRDRFYVIVGGGPVTPDWAEEIKADGYARLATEAVEMCQKLVNSGKQPPLDRPTIIGAQTND